MTLTLLFEKLQELTNSINISSLTTAEAVEKKLAEFREMESRLKSFNRLTKKQIANLEKKPYLEDDEIAVRKLRLLRYKSIVLEDFIAKTDELCCAFEKVLRPQEK